MTRCARCQRADCAHPDPVYQGVIPHVPTGLFITGAPLARDHLLPVSFHASPSISQVQQDHG